MLKRTFISPALIALALLALPSCWPFKKAPDSIVESPSVSSIYDYLNENEYNHKTLVIFDIDNTTLRPSTHLGSDEWFYALVKQREARGMSHQDAVDEVLPLYFYAQKNIDVVPVEENTSEVINDLQRHGITVIALTARSFDLTYLTIKQLNALDIHLGVNMPHKCPIKFTDNNPALFIDGVIFVGGHDKGEVLTHWLAQLHFKPTKIIFIDDKLVNVQSVERAVHKENIPFVGIRYSHLDDYIKTLDLDELEKELGHFIKKHPYGYPASILQKIPNEMPL